MLNKEKLRRNKKLDQVQKLNREVYQRVVVLIIVNRENQEDLQLDDIN